MSTTRARTFPVLIIAGIAIGCGAPPEEQKIPEAPALFVDQPPRERAPEPVMTAWVLQRGQTLSSVLTRARLPETDQLVGELSKVVNPRYLRPGITIASTEPAADSPAVHVRLNDVVIRASFSGDTWRARVDSVRLHTDTVVVGAVLRVGESVLGAADRAIVSLPPIDRAVLVAEFVELYRDQVNFRRDMRAGDSFIVMATRRVRPDGTVRDHQILAAELTVRQQAHHRIFFSHGQGAGYFTPDGHAVRASLTRFPIRPPRITSSFNRRRRHPVLGIVRPHFGLDLHAPPGTAVQAVGDGRVTRAGREGGYGIAVFVDHGRGVTTRYAHLGRLADRITRGRRVVRGQTIGYSGSTGNSAGPHLHYELLLNGRPVNPATTRLPTDEPVGEEALEAFRAVVRTRMPRLRLSTGDQIADLPPANRGAGFP